MPQVNQARLTISPEERLITELTVSGVGVVLTLLGGRESMIEHYESFCIPVFGDPNSPMGSQNNYSCDFVNSAKTQTAYVVLHEDRPKGVLKTSRTSNCSRFPTMLYYWNPISSSTTRLRYPSIIIGLP